MIKYQVHCMRCLTIRCYSYLLQVMNYVLFQNLACNGKSRMGLNQTV